MKRRQIIKNLGGLIVAPSLLSATVAAPKKGLRLVHLTDVHLKDKWDAPARFRRCLAHVRGQQPDLIVNGGDIVFDMNKENLDVIGAQWKLWHQIVDAESPLPMHYVLGNHDIWWNEDDKGQALYGKQYAMEQLKLVKPYYAFQQGGWKFIMLDSVHLDIDGTWYIGKLGDEQFGWLSQELAGTPAGQAVCVVSHIPILTATNLIEDNIVNKWEMTGGDMHTDTSKIIDLFYQYPNVKLCLSGHIHLREKIVYNNVTYICDGAVSGAWWEGNRRQTAPGYGMLELFGDGTFTERYVNY